MEITSVSNFRLALRFVARRRMADWMPTLSPRIPSSSHLPVLLGISLFRAQGLRAAMVASVSGIRHAGIMRPVLMDVVWRPRAAQGLRSLGQISVSPTPARMLVVRTCRPQHRIACPERFRLSVWVCW